MDSYITGQTIKRLREEKRLTQTQLAEKMGVSECTFSKSLRREFDAEKKARIMKIIDELSKAR